MRGRFTGDVYYYTALPQGGEGREREGWGERSKTFPSPFLFCAYTEATQGVESFVSRPHRRQGEVVFVLVEIEKGE